MVQIVKRISSGAAQMKGEQTMGNRALENRIKKLLEIKAQQKALDQQAEAIEAEIKAIMESQGTEELNTGNFIVRWKSIATNKFDTKAFSKEYSYLYEQFIKKSESKRFTVA
jgi:predicted phage-related endonuclease